MREHAERQFLPSLAFCLVKVVLRDCMSKVAFVSPLRLLKLLFHCEWLRTNKAGIEKNDLSSCPHLMMSLLGGSRWAKRKRQRLPITRFARLLVDRKEHVDKLLVRIDFEARLLKSRQSCFVLDSALEFAQLALPGTAISNRHDVDRRDGLLA